MEDQQVRPQLLPDADNYNSPDRVFSQSSKPDPKSVFKQLMISDRNGSSINGVIHSDVGNSTGLISTNVGLVHSVNETVNVSMSENMNFVRKAVDEEFVCGWGAAFINITCTFPVNKTIFRQQLQGISGYQAIQQLHKEGFRNLYRGFLPPLLQKTTTLSIMFGSYHEFQIHLDSSFSSLPKSLNHAVAAMLAGTLEATLTPFERIQTLMQDHMYQIRFINTVHASKELWEFGIREYYRGLSPILYRNGPSNVCFFLGREFLSEHTPNLEHSSSRIVKDFVCGACLGALISTFFFPLNVVKTRMQSRLGGPFHSFWHTFKEIWLERNRSVACLYRGFHLNYTRSFISWGIINASYEFLMRLMNQMKLGRS